MVTVNRPFRPVEVSEDCTASNTMKLFDFFPIYEAIDVDDRSDDPRYFTVSGRHYRIEEAEFYWALFDLGLNKEISDPEVIKRTPGLEKAYTAAVDAAEKAGLGSQEEWSPETASSAQKISDFAASKDKTKSKPKVQC